MGRLGVLHHTLAASEPANGPAACHAKRCRYHNGSPAMGRTTTPGDSGNVAWHRLSAWPDRTNSSTTRPSASWTVRRVRPVVAYNNPIDTKVDLVPELLKKLHEAGYIKAVKEFSGDTRRAYHIKELAPDLDLLIGADDVLLELATAGAVGWISGYPNALPSLCNELYRAATAGDVATALPLYRELHPLLRWDSHTEFVQAIKLSMDLAGRHGGVCRPPHTELAPEHHQAIKSDTLRVLPLEQKAKTNRLVAATQAPASS
ncbi:hypothetical protein ABIA35_005152 [Catenulispora sp. MAP12-49]